MRNWRERERERERERKRERESVFSNRLLGLRVYIEIVMIIMLE